jgi:Zn-finger nucleic acid-binding protein
LILVCAGCQKSYDVTGFPVGQELRCKCGKVNTLKAPRASRPEIVVETRPSPKPSAPNIVEHAPAPAGPRCPRCAIAMLPRSVSDVVLEECPQCDGLFLDQDSMQRVISDRSHALATAVLAALPAAIATQTTGKLYIKCPICQHVMNRRLFGAGSGVIVDVCHMHGTYFDVGELPRIVAWVADGGLERAQQKRIDELHEQTRREQLASGWRGSIVVDDSERTTGDAFVDLLTALLG